MKQTTFLLIGAALVIIAVMALAAGGCHGTPAPPAPLPTTVVEPPAATPEHTEDTSGLRQQTLPDTGGIKLLAR